jgi:hypothetical protein
MVLYKVQESFLLVGEQSERKVYGVEESKLGEFYAQRTILKKEVLPEHIAAGVFAIVGGELPLDNWITHSESMAEILQLSSTNFMSKYAAAVDIRCN